MNEIEHTYRMQRDLAGLPEPKFLHDTPPWLHVFVTVTAGFGGILGVGSILQGMGDVAARWAYVGLGALLCSACAWFMFVLKPGDWRNWINLAADCRGLYLVGRGRQVIFVPWADVHKISVETRISGSGETTFARLRLTMDDANWSRTSRFASIEGEGSTRDYILPSVARSGAEVAAQLKAFKDGTRCA
jgi:hypothetical protein